MGIYEELQERGLIAQVTDEDKIRDLINSGEACFYIGFDPTADSLHIGHFMALILLIRLFKANNSPIVLLGGGTAHIGDPTGKTDMRRMMSKEEIDYNVECFKKQISRYVDANKVLFVNNADWLLGLNYIDILRDVGPHFMVNNMLRAECYKQRMEKGLSFLEFNYMIMQSYDFYYLFKKYNCSIQFGGDDQWSNMLAGTELIRKKLNKDAYALTINLLLNSEGKKMGKTEKGAIWLDANKTSPFEFYQYWRNINDNDVIKCLKTLTFIPLDKIKEYERYDSSRINELKEILAFSLTSLVHGDIEAKKAQNMAHNLFSGEGNVMPTCSISINNDINVLDLLVLSKLCFSKSEARRLVIQNGLAIDNQKIIDPNFIISKSSLLKGIKIKKGKKTFLKVLIK